MAGTPTEDLAARHTALATELTAVHERLFGGGGALTIASAPGRVNLIGEHVDYNDGLCMPFALAQRTLAVVRPRPDRVLRLHSVDVRRGATVTIDLDQVGSGHTRGWGSYVAGVFWAMEQAGLSVPGADIVVGSTVPVGAGLSSSAALEGAVAIALDALGGHGLADTDAGRARLAGLCQQAENVVAGAPTGGMDQAASLRAEADHALLLDCRSGAIEQVPLSLSGTGLSLLVIDTRAHHALVDGQYAARRAQCQAGAEALGVASLREVPVEHLDAALARLDDPVRRRVRHVVTDIERVREVATLLRDGALAEIGPILTTSHHSLRDDFEVSCEELDLAVDSALASGALGARMVGGGFGGSVLALVPTAAISQITESVAMAFSGAGFEAPRSFPAEPSAPADVGW